MAGTATKATKGRSKGRSLPKHVSGAVLANFVGLSERRLGQLAEAGMPKVKRGTYPLQDAVRWYAEFLRKNRVALRQTEPTKSELVRQILAHKLKKLQSEVFDRQEVMDVTTAAVVRLRVAHENLTTRIGLELNLQGEDIEVIREMLGDMRRAFIEDCGHLILDPERKRLP